MTMIERIEEIQRSIVSCHPSREVDIKLQCCIEALAEEIDRQAEVIKAIQDGKK